MSITNRLCTLMLALAAFACVPSTAPNLWLRDVDQMPVNAYGAWTIIEGQSLQIAATPTSGEALGSQPEEKAVPVRKPFRIEGEFIATTGDSVIILDQKSGICSIGHRNIQTVTMELYKKNTTNYAIWTGLGFLSTISHGWYLMFSAPAWLITGTLVTTGESYRDRWHEIQPSSAWWAEMRLFARFPQGLPPGVDLQSLEQKKTDAAR